MPLQNLTIGLARFAIYNLDVRRIVPLGNLLVQQLRDISTEAKKEGDSLHDAKILQFVQPFLAETSVRDSLHFMMSTSN